MIRNFPLKNWVTMAVGGPAKYFTTVKSEGSLLRTLEFAGKNKLPWLTVGDGSNLIPNDAGFDGLIIRNKIVHLKRRGNLVIVGAGKNLLQFIFFLNRSSLAGLEKMAGIPGTVGGAIYGCAGAYGQEIKDHLIGIRFFDGKIFRWLSKKDCRFEYRSSIFKKNKNWIIAAARFRFNNQNSNGLMETSRQIMKTRLLKYPAGLLCPGSFFKNIVLNKLSIDLRKKLASLAGEKLKQWHGKIPAGWLLEQVGAKGMAIGKIRIAEHHGNLIYNSGNAKSADIEKVAKILKNRVKRKFGVVLEEEVQFIK